jgi:hypothetical protein
MPHQAYQQYRGLYGVKPTIMAQRQTEFPIDNPRMAEHSYAFGTVIVIAKNNTAIAKASRNLHGIEAYAGNISEGAAWPLAEGSAECLCAIFYHMKPVFASDLIDFGHARESARKVNGEDSLGAGCNQRHYGRGVHVQCLIDIAQHGHGTIKKNCAAGSQPGEWRRDDFVPRPYPQRL